MKRKSHKKVWFGVLFVIVAITCAVIFATPLVSEYGDDSPLDVSISQYKVIDASNVVLTISVAKNGYTENDTVYTVLVESLKGDNEYPVKIDVNKLNNQYATHYEVSVTGESVHALVRYLNEQYDSAKNAVTEFEYNNKSDTLFGVPTTDDEPLTYSEKQALDQEKAELNTTLFDAKRKLAADSEGSNNSFDAFISNYFKVSVE